MEFIEKRPQNTPFFLMMHHKAPHRPWEPSDDHAAHFAGQRIPEPVTFWDTYATLATVQSVDDSVGRVVNDPYELHNLYGEPRQHVLTAALKLELARLKREVRDDDQLAEDSCQTVWTGQSPGCGVGDGQEIR